MFTRRWLQLAFQQLLQVVDALGLVEQGLERFFLAQQCGGDRAGKGRKDMAGRLKKTEWPW